MTTFNPQYLKELREMHQNTLDNELIEQVKKEILEANLEGEEGVELSFRADSAFEKIIKYFEDRGFWVGSSGYTKRQYDSDGNRIYWYQFVWSVDENGDE